MKTMKVSQGANGCRRVIGRSEDDSPRSERVGLVAAIEFISTAGATPCGAD